MSNVEQAQQSSPVGPAANSNKYKNYLIEKLLNESPSIVKSVVNTEEKEDALSETGTYTIEDDLNMHNKKVIDLETARAEIDEKFGIVRPEINEQSIQIVTTPRRQTQTIRVRNKTYSLANDIVDNTQNISCTSSETSSSHSISKLPKTTTYNVISETTNPDSSRTVATNVLLGDTENLIKELKKTRTLTKIQVGANPENLSSSSASSSSTNLSNENIKPKMWTIPSCVSPIPNNKINLDSVSTRATVNFDDNDENEMVSTPKKTGGLAFEFNLTPDNNFVAKNLVKTERNESDILTNRSNESILTLTKGFELRKNRRDLASSINSTSSFNTQLNTPKSNAPSGLSLGARIQEKAKENLSSPPKRRGSDSTTPSNLQYTNRTLYLRQQSAKAKRDSLEKTEDFKNSTRSPKPKDGILKKNNTPPTGRNSSLTRSSLVSPKNNARPGNLKKSSRNPSPCDNNLMTGSLNLPSGSSLPISLTDSFQRRKMYDPLKSVQAEKIKKQKEIEHKKILQNNSANDFGDFDSMSDSSYNSLPNQQTDYQNQSHRLNKALYITHQKPPKAPLMRSISLKSNTENSTYEKILQSTLQRLCIRLIQMSTGVLDRIGDNRSSLCDSIQTLSTSSDLERMQILTKLVNNMQIVHDNMQIIDQTLTNQKMEDSYIKELTRIRQEVDYLKQSACLTSPNQSIRSNVLNNSFETN